MRDNSKRKRDEEHYYMQTINETGTYQSGPTVTSQNIQTPVIEENPSYSQSLLVNQPVLQNQQLLYQLQRTTDAQQNLVYLLVPSNENIQVQPLTVVNEHQNSTQYIGSPQINNHTDERIDNTLLLQGVKEEGIDVKSEYYTEDITSNHQKNIQYSYTVPKVNTETTINNSYNSNQNYNEVYPKSTSSNSKETASPTKPHWYRCDYKDCSESFYSLYEKKQHLDAHIFPENTEFKCSICNMVFEKAIDRNKHVESHAVPPTFKCKHCQNDFTYFTVLMKHLEETQCSSKTPITCFFCETKISDYYELVRHNQLNMKQCTCGIKICGNQAYDLHIGVCKAVKANEKVQAPFEKKRLKTKKT